MSRFLFGASLATQQGCTASASLTASYFSTARSCHSAGLVPPTGRRLCAALLAWTTCVCRGGMLGSALSLSLGWTACDGGLQRGGRELLKATRKRPGESAATAAVFVPSREGKMLRGLVPVSSMCHPASASSFAALFGPGVWTAGPFEGPTLA